MPATAQQEDDESVPHHLGLAHSASTQWNIDIVAEPRRQGNVPSTPKFSNVAAEIRYIEIPH